MSGYGVINYANFNWHTDPERRARIDVERFVVSPKYKVSEDMRLEAELEFEHGGTGITMEFDKFEEFGEFEMEVEKGGEVIVEKLAIVFEIEVGNSTSVSDTSSCPLGYGFQETSSATLLHRHPARIRIAT